MAEESEREADRECDPSRPPGARPGPVDEDPDEPGQQPGADEPLARGNARGLIAIVPRSDAARVTDREEVASISVNVRGSLELT
jgi:hypothetical protein